MDQSKHYDDIIKSVIIGKKKTDTQKRPIS